MFLEELKGVQRYFVLYVFWTVSFMAGVLKGLTRFYVEVTHSSFSLPYILHLVEAISVVWAFTTMSCTRFTHLSANITALQVVHCIFTEILLVLHLSFVSSAWVLTSAWVAGLCVWSSVQVVRVSCK